MFEYKTVQVIKRPINEVFNFFEKPENLGKITPTKLGFNIKTTYPLVMKKGAIFDYTIRFGLIRFPWKSLITLYNPPILFQDIQKKGPYKKWEHTHEFVDMGESTKIIDTIKYDLYPTFLRSLINKIFIEKNINQIFTFRKKIINKIFNK